MSRRNTKDRTRPQSRPTARLRHDAERAARGDEMALVRLFDEIGPQAWGLAFVVTGRTEPSAEAVASAFVSTFDACAKTAIVDIRTHLLKATYLAATETEGTSEQRTARHAREPMDVEAGAADLAAMEALAALPRAHRLALWLLDGDDYETNRASRITGWSNDDLVGAAETGRQAFLKTYLSEFDVETSSVEAAETTRSLQAAIAPAPVWLLDLIRYSRDESSAGRRGKLVWWTRTRLRPLVFIANVVAAIAVTTAGISAFHQDGGVADATSAGADNEIDQSGFVESPEPRPTTTQRQTTTTSTVKPSARAVAPATSQPKPGTTTSTTSTTVEPDSVTTTTTLAVNTADATASE